MPGCVDAAEPGLPEPGRGILRRADGTEQEIPVVQDPAGGRHLQFPEPLQPGDQFWWSHVLVVS